MLSGVARFKKVHAAKRFKDRGVVIFGKDIQCASQGTTEDGRFLLDDADTTAKLCQTRFRNIDSVNPDRSLRWFDEAEQAQC